MTREEAKEIFLNRGFVNGIFDGDKWRQSIVVISDWLKQEPCEDAISRQAVLDGVDRYIHKSQSTGTQDDLYSFAELVVKKLPSVTPQQKTGHWIEHPHEAGENFEYPRYECSECNAWVDDDIDFCPYCGSKNL